jgi:hypothetical protein
MLATQKYPLVRDGELLTNSIVRLKDFFVNHVQEKVCLVWCACVSCVFFLGGAGWKQGGNSEERCAKSKWMRLNYIGVVPGIR